MLRAREASAAQLLLECSFVGLAPASVALATRHTSSFIVPTVTAVYWSLRRQQLAPPSQAAETRLGAWHGEGPGWGGEDSGSRAGVGAPLCAYGEGVKFRLANTPFARPRKFTEGRTLDLLANTLYCLRFVKPQAVQCWPRCFLLACERECGRKATVPFSTFCNRGRGVGGSELQPPKPLQPPKAPGRAEAFPPRLAQLFLWRPACSRCAPSGARAVARGLARQEDYPAPTGCCEQGGSASTLPRRRERPRG